MSNYRTKPISPTHGNGEGESGNELGRTELRGGKIEVGKEREEGGIGWWKIK